METKTIKEELNDLIIIDFETKGNVVRFYLGDPAVNDYWGDDWNDTPYEHNAGPVYDEYVINTVDIAFPFTCTVLEPKDDWHNQGNSNYSKEDMKKRIVPCILIVKDDDDYHHYDEFNYYLGDANTVKIYFGDKISSLNNMERMFITRQIDTIIL